MKNQQKAALEYELISTEDGSSSLRDLQTGETFHSTHGALTESQLVYIQNGLEYLIEKESIRTINLLEIGFGSGLNALLSLSVAKIRSIQINYTAIEAFPLRSEQVEKLNFVDQHLLEPFKSEFRDFHSSEELEKSFCEGLFHLKKMKVDLLAFEPAKSHFNLIFFDAFSANVQPELWTKEVFQKLFHSLKSSGVLVTYSAKGIVKTALRDSGFIVERLTGPPGKRHVIRALKSNFSEA
jgi:tRNA U34 5-methylaminomethyl-2-thiouridine-forming methyltransferase MnmC